MKNICGYCQVFFRDFVVFRENISDLYDEIELRRSGMFVALERQGIPSKSSVGATCLSLMVRYMAPLRSRSMDMLLFYKHATPTEFIWPKYFFL